jgi:acyl-CoA synthetase (NDP forming)
MEETTIQKLRSLPTPWEISPNPWDLGVTLQFNDPFHVYRILVESAVEDPNVDALLIQLPPKTELLPEKFFQVFQEARDTHKPIALWLPGVEPGGHEVFERVEENQVLVFPSPEKAIRALSALYRLSGETNGRSPG